MGRNGYNESLFDTQDGECFICGRKGDTVRHEVYGGANRKVSKKYGLWIAVCPQCHQYSPVAIHRNPLSGYDLELKKMGQRLFEIENERGKFLHLFGRSYL